MSAHSAGRVPILDNLAQEPPHNIACEQALLGVIFVNNDTWDRVSDIVEPQHFFEPVHQRIFELCSNLIREGKKATPVTLKTFLPADAVVAGMPIQRYLSRVMAEATAPVNAADYAKLIRSLSDRRGILTISRDLERQAMEGDETLAVSELVEQTEEALFDLVSIEREGNGFMPFKDAVKDSIDLAAKAYQRDGGLSGIATGLSDLDAHLGGLQRSDLIIIAGRPGLGKTALATNIAYNVASEYRGKPLPDGSIETISGGIVGFFSLEMSSEQLATRVLSERAEVPSSRIRRGDIRESEFKVLADKATDIENIPLYIEQRGGLSIAQLCSRARRLKRQRGLDLMVVDYIQLLSGTQNRQGNRTQEVTEITTKLKALAKELNIPILALSQLNRSLESREDKRPMLSDLRESGSIEQDADVVMFVYRDEYYLAKAEPKEGTEEWFEWKAKIDAAKGKADLIVDKQRHGPTGTVPVAFEAQFTRFGNLAREYQQQRGNVVPFNERGDY